MTVLQEPLVAAEGENRSCREWVTEVLHFFGLFRFLWSCLPEGCRQSTCDVTSRGSRPLMKVLLAVAVLATLGLAVYDYGTPFVPEAVAARQKQQDEVQKLEGALVKQQKELNIERTEVHKLEEEVKALQQETQKKRQEVITSSDPWIATWDLSGYDFSSYKTGQHLLSPAFDLGGLHGLTLYLEPKDGTAGYEGRTALYLCAPDGYQVNFSLRLDEVALQEESDKFLRSYSLCWGRDTDVWGSPPPTRFGSAVLLIRSVTSLEN